MAQHILTYTSAEALVAQEVFKAFLIRANLEEERENFKEFEEALTDEGMQTYTELVEVDEDFDRNNESETGKTLWEKIMWPSKLDCGLWPRKKLNTIAKFIAKSKNKALYERLCFAAEHVDEEDYVSYYYFHYVLDVVEEIKLFMSLEGKNPRAEKLAEWRHNNPRNWNSPNFWEKKTLKSDKRHERFIAKQEIQRYIEEK